MFLERRKLEVYFRSHKEQDRSKLKALMKKMAKNVDLRGDQEEAVLERIMFATLALHMGEVAESGIYCREVRS